MTDENKHLNYNQFKINRLLINITIVSVFSIAFAYIESAVVVYLREIFHPEGFTFPIKVFNIKEINTRLLWTEIGREAATIVLILTSCWLSGNNRRQRFAYFLMIFAIWDIFYYFWLKVLINWPMSIMDYDILFLIPTVWASPILAPILCSITMLVFSLITLLLDLKGLKLKVTYIDWSGYVLASIIIVTGFCYTGQYSDKLDFKQHYSWLIFALGQLIAISIFSYRAFTADHVNNKIQVSD